MSGKYFEIKKSTIFWIIGLIIFFVWVYWPVEEYEKREPITFTEEEGGITDQFSHTSELHWGHIPITYFYEEDCIGPIIERIEWAFDIIENDTNNLISFQEVNYSADINFVCYEEQERIGIPGGTEYTQGLTTTDTLESIITHAKIEFWSVSKNTRPTSCYSFPGLEIHEILHALGFEHIFNNKFSIMYPFSDNCGQIPITKNGITSTPKHKFDDNIVSCLKYTYSKGETGECSSLNLDHGRCSDGWFEIEATNTFFCCPEPNMSIVGGNCV